MGARRNLIIVLTHGLRADVAGDGPDWPYVAPNIEKLALRGQRMIATAACVADPGGMVSLLTGLHARQHGHVHPMRGPVACAGWAAGLREQGYHLAGVGCVTAIERWLNEAVLVDDVDHTDSVRCAYLSAMAAKGYKEAISLQRPQRQRYGPFEPDRLLLEPDDDIDGYIAAQALATLQRMPDDRRWALVVALNGPGNDLPAPIMYDQLADEITLDMGFTLPDFRTLDDLAELDYPRTMLQRMEPHRLAQIRADYLGRVSLIDHGLGRIVDALEQRSDRSRTWTVLASDRGYLLGEHGLVGHRSFLAGAVEAPAIITPPTPARRAEHDGLLSTVDIAATIGALGGCDLSPAVTGRSLLPLLAGEPIAHPSSAMLCEFGHRLMLETERYKVIFDTKTRDAIGLYDLLNDPRELENLIHGMTGRNIIDALRWRLGDALMGLRAEPCAL